MGYDEAKKKAEAAALAVAKAEAKLRIAKADLDIEIKKLPIACACGAETAISKLEMIEEITSGRFSCSENDWVYSTREYPVCPACHSPMGCLDNTGPFVDGVKKYVKAVHSWSSYNQGPSKDVTRLLGPYWEEQARKKAERIREDRITEARKILIEAGELKDEESK